MSFATCRRGAAALPTGVVEPFHSTLQPVLMPDCSRFARLRQSGRKTAVWQKKGAYAPQTACFFGQTAELPDCHSLAESIFCSLARGTAAWQIRRPRLLYYLPDCRHLGAAWERSLQFPPHFGILSSLAARGANFPQTAAVWQF